MVNGFVDLVEAVELLPEDYGIVPIVGLLLYLVRIFNIISKSVEPGVSRLALHCHSEGGNNSGENVLMSVKNELNVEDILNVSVDEVVRKSLTAVLFKGERRQSTVCSLCTECALEVVFGEQL